MTNSIRPIWFFAILLFLSTISVQGQTKPDSLLNALEKATDDQERTKILLNLSEISLKPRPGLSYAKQSLSFAYQIESPLFLAKSLQQVGRWQAQLDQQDSAKLNLAESIKLFQELGQSKGMSKSLAYMGLAYEELYKMDSAAVFYKEAIAISDSIQDRSGYALYNLYLGDMENIRGNNGVALEYLKIANNYFDSPDRSDSSWISLNSLAIVYDEMGMYAKALEYYLKAYNLVAKSEMHESKLILANNLGVIYQELGKLEEANDFYSRGLEVAKMNDLKSDEAMLLNNISLIHAEKRDTLLALKLLRRAHKIQIEENLECDLAYTCEGLGEVMVWQKKYDSAHHFYEEALKWANTCELEGGRTSIYRNKGLLALNQGRLNTAERHLLKSLQLAQKSNYGLEKKESAKSLFNFYQQTKNDKSALKYHLMYSTLKDSLFNVESTERIARMTSEYDFKREMESLEYRKMADEMRLNDELRQKENYQNSILVVLVLTTLLAATLGRSYYLMQNNNKKLKALNEEKNTLMGVVAHDLRSPLNNIKGLMSLVKMENSELSPEQQHYFHLVDDTMDRMRDMIDRVLDVSVVEDMKVSLNLKKVDLGQTMNFVAGNFEMLASKKSIKIHSNLDVEKHFIFADYNYLLQVIENLLSNAIKFSESGKNIFLTVFQEEGSETMIIRDEGPGICEEDQSRLFTKFQKLTAKPTDNEQSTGLGLSIVKKFLDAMEAEISCESELGLGTSFVVQFKTVIEQEVV